MSEINKSRRKTPKWLFVFNIIGGIALIIGFIILINLPDNPTHPTTLTETETRQCISGSKFIDEDFGEGVFTFYSDGSFYTDTGGNGTWSVVGINRIRLDYNPNPYGVTVYYIHVKSCNRIMVGETPYVKR